MKQEIDQTRRQFLRGKFLTRDGRHEIDQVSDPIGPSLPWHAGAIMQQDCAGCAQPCVEACETDIIKIHPAEHAFAGLPYLEFRDAGCTHCFECVTACPVELDADSNDKPVIGLVSLDRTSCHSWNDVFCISCRYVCDTEAIVFTWQKFPEVNSAVCTGCGACVSVCPANSLSVTSLPD